MGAVLFPSLCCDFVTCNFLFPTRRACLPQLTRQFGSSYGRSGVAGPQCSLNLALVRGRAEWSKLKTPESWVLWYPYHQALAPSRSGLQECGEEGDAVVKSVPVVASQRREPGQKPVSGGSSGVGGVRRAGIGRDEDVRRPVSFTVEYVEGGLPPAPCPSLAQSFCLPPSRLGRFCLCAHRAPPSALRQPGWVPERNPSWTVGHRKHPYPCHTRPESGVMR